MAEGEAPPAVQIRDLRTQFGVQVVHDGLELDILQGEIIRIVGGSGSGKSVLLRAIIGLVRPTRGTIAVFGQDLRALDDGARAAVERRWGVLYQDGALFSSLTVAQNVALPLREHSDLPTALIDEIVALKIGLVGLPPEAGGKYPSELSGGMRKRGGLARAMALDPELLFLDEPKAGLDPIAAAAFDRLIVRLQRAMGLTVFMATHDLHSLNAICDRIAVLAEKRVVVCGPLEMMLTHPYPWAREYFHGPRARTALAR